MAFYLRRAFGEDVNVLVFNDLRLERPEASGAGRPDAAQIDHLLLHRQGMIVIESKSVTGRVRVNELGEFTRVWGGGEEGMASPVMQARRQVEFLRLYLRDHAPRLLNRIFGIADGRIGMVQGGFGALPIDVLVAISDTGIIERPRPNDPPELLKADLVPDRARQLIAEHRRLANPLRNPVGDMGRTLSPEEVGRVRDFLLAEHRPTRHQAPAGPPPLPVTPPVTVAAPAPPLLPASPAFICRECKRTGPDVLEMLWGRHSYYFKCRVCGGNTPVDPTLLRCDGCGGRSRIRKSGPQFFVECAACPAAGSRLLYVNSPAPQ